MRRVSSLLLIFTIFFSGISADRSKSAEPAGDAIQEPDSGSVVCAPAVYISAEDCLPLGPSEYLTKNAEQGLPYPLLPLPAYAPPSSLAATDYRYFRVNDQGVPLFSSLDNAIANRPSGKIDPGLHLYVSYQDGPIITSDGGTYYQLRSGLWIPAEGGRLGRFNPLFQGLEFSSQPHNSFGWILGDVQPVSAPGMSSPENGHLLHRFNIVQVYAIQEVDNLQWDLIGPDEWVEARQVARVDPHTNAPEDITGNRWIEVNLFEQTLSVYDNNRLVYATMTSTGVAPFWTRPGLFQIYEKKPTETMSGSTEADRSDYYYLEDVPWTMYFDEARALHGAYWHNMFGYPQSHGCVNLSEGDAHWLYDWANVGDYVYVYDPSGKTPTDAAAYGAGSP
jgi:hypothetical protein